MKTLITIILLISSSAFAQGQLLSISEVATVKGLYACGCQTSAATGVYTALMDEALSAEAVERRCETMEGMFARTGGGHYVQLLTCGLQINTAHSAPLVAPGGGFQQQAAQATTPGIDPRYRPYTPEEARRASEQAIRDAQMRRRWRENAEEQARKKQLEEELRQTGFNK